MAVWLDCRHSAPSEPVPQAGKRPDEYVHGLLAPGAPAVRLGADPVEIVAAMADRRNAVTVGPVHSVTGYRRAMDTMLTALETAVAEGAARPAHPMAIEYSLPGVDAAVNARLDLVGSWEAKAMRGRAGLAGAHLMYAALQRDLATDRWARLLAGGARAPYLLWSTGGPSVPADRSVDYAEKCLFPGTALALSPAALREFDERGLVTGPTALDAAEARRVVATIAWFGVRLDATVG
ncbi:hypothetical protein EAO75_33665 [Streptomyces sp. uw30]|nr:hypothetical protein EAO75_33665 [Streptomyces sp. uw30]